MHKKIKDNGSDASGLLAMPHRLIRAVCSLPQGLPWLWMSLAFIATAHTPILSSFFIADDFLHTYQIANWRPLEFIFSSHGGHLYIFRNSVFYAMFKAFGMHATPYFAVVLITHLAGCALLFKVLQLITGRQIPAAMGTMLWGASPLLEGTMAWYSVYGHVLTGLFFLLFFYDLVRVDKGLLPFSARVAFRWSAYIVLMATSFGNGLATAGLAPVTAGLILWHRERKWQIAATLVPAVLLVVGLYAAKDTMFAMAGGIGGQSGPKPLSEALRLALPILEMTARMGAYSIYPPYVLLARFAYPNLALFATLPVGLLFLYLIFRSGAFRRYYIAVAMLLLGVIAVTAYGRAPFYLFLNIPIHNAAITPRYYYLILLLAVVLLTIMAHDLLDNFHRVTGIAMTIAVVGLALLTPVRYLLVKKLVDFGNAPSQKKIYEIAVASIDAHIRDAPDGKPVYIDNTMPEKLMMFFQSDTDFPGMAAVFAITYPRNTVNGRRVFFVEPDSHVLDLNLAHKHWRIGSLMVSASDVNKSSDQQEIFNP